MVDTNKESEKIFLYVIKLYPQRADHFNAPDVKAGLDTSSEPMSLGL